MSCVIGIAHELDTLIKIYVSVNIVSLMIQPVFLELYCLLAKHFIFDCPSF